MLVDSGQMRLQESGEEIAPGIRCVITPGHTPGHQSVIIEDDGEAAMVVSDLASYSIHFANLAWMTAYDVEPLVTLESKRIWQKWAMENDATLIFVHDPLIPAGRLIENEKGRMEVIPVE